MWYQRKTKRIDARQVVVNTTVTLGILQVDVPEGAYVIYEADRPVRWIAQDQFEANYEPEPEPEPVPEPADAKEPDEPEEKPEQVVGRRKRT